MLTPEEIEDAKRAALEENLKDPEFRRGWDSMTDLFRRADERDAAIERAEATIARVRAAAEDMRQWCSPYGVAADYANHILAALNPPKEDAWPHGRSSPRRQIREPG